MSDAGMQPYDINGDGLPDIMARAGTPTPFLNPAASGGFPGPFGPAGLNNMKQPTPFGPYGQNYGNRFGTPDPFNPMFAPLSTVSQVPWNSDPRSFPGAYYPQNNLYNPGPYTGTGGIPRRDDINHYEIRSLGELDALLRGDPRRRTLVQFYDSSLIGQLTGTSRTLYLTNESEWKDMARDYLKDAVFARVDISTIMGANYAFIDKRGEIVKKPLYKAFHTDGRPVTGGEKAMRKVNHMREWVEQYHS